jgi:predicted MFS family arabinose efflux permease
MPQRDAVVAVGITILFTAFVGTTYGFGTYLFPFLMPDMRVDLGLSYSDVGLMTASAQIGYLVAAVGSGALASRLGAGRIIVGSMMLCTIALGLLTVTSAPWATGVLLTLLGAMGASAWVPMARICQRFIPDRHRGKSLGLMSSGTSYGVFVNGLLAPYVLAFADWRAVWLIVSIGTGAITAAGVAFLASLGILKRPVARRAPLPDDRVPAADIWQRLRPLINTGNATVWLMMLVSGFAAFSYQTYLSAYVTEELSFPIETAGFAWTVIGLTGMGAGFVVGGLADRLTIRRGLLVSFVLLGAAGLLLLWRVESGVTAIYVSSVTFGLAFYAIFGLFPAYMSRTVPQEDLSMVSGVGHTFMGLGGVFGNFLGGQLKDLTGTFDWNYVLVVGSGLVLVAMTLLVLPSDRAAT